MERTTVPCEETKQSPNKMVDEMENPGLAPHPSIESLSLDEKSNEKEEDRQPSNNDSAKTETKEVAHHKLLVLLILLVSATIIATCVFVYISKGETSRFEDKFNNDATKVIDAIGSSLHRTLGLLDFHAVTSVSHARNQNATWPFVTIPDFGADMAKLLPLTDATVITMLPIVSPELREVWEAYSVENDNWVNQTIALQEKWVGFRGEINHGWQPKGSIYGDDGVIETNIRYGISKSLSH
jgi:hypothetical protein